MLATVASGERCATPCTRCRSPATQYIAHLPKEFLESRKEVKREVVELFFSTTSLA